LDFGASAMTRFASERIVAPDRRHDVRDRLALPDAGLGERGLRPRVRFAVMADLLIVGGGRMGEALLGGLIADGRPAEAFAVAEVYEPRREELTDAYPGVAVVEAPVAAAGAVLAVKPYDVAAAASAVAEAGCKRILSVAAGITTGAIEEAIGSPLPVVRAMPNTPALVGAGVTAIAPGSAAGEHDLEWAEEILFGVGAVVRVKESALDAVTGLSGSGPAYVFLVAEAMAEAGVLAGLPRDLAETLAFETLYGAAKLLREADDGPADLRAAVTSPGGTTAAGLRELERAGVRAAFLEAVMAATQRSRELGT
jgi:pyrroline-5-carboxylate reductase